MSSIEQITQCDNPTLLPLARSRIDALRRGGMMYGSQTFIVGGSTVNLQLKGDMNYVRISGAGEMKMESGVVYLCPSLLPLEGSGVYLPGTLHDVARATVYNAKFTDTVTRKGSTWKINPDHGDAGQYSGEIYFSGFIKGRIPSDNYSVSNAFAPGHVYDSNTSGWVQKDAGQYSAIVFLSRSC